MGRLGACGTPTGKACLPGTRERSGLETGAGPRWWLRSQEGEQEQAGLRRERQARDVSHRVTVAACSWQWGQSKTKASQAEQDGELKRARKTSQTHSRDIRKAGDRRRGSVTAAIAGPVGGAATSPSSPREGPPLRGPQERRTSDSHLPSSGGQGSPRNLGSSTDGRGSQSPGGRGQTPDDIPDVSGHTGEAGAGGQGSKLWERVWDQLPACAYSTKLTRHRTNGEGFSQEKAEECALIEADTRTALVRKGRGSVRACDPQQPGAASLVQPSSGNRHTLPTAAASRGRHPAKNAHAHGEPRPSPTRPRRGAQHTSGAGGNIIYGTEPRCPRVST